MATWLGTSDLPVIIRPGRSSIMRITLAAGGREIVLEEIAT